MKSIITLDNSTLAQKARRYLARSGIDAVLTKLSDEGAGGCNFALEIDGRSLYDAVYLLRHAEINFRVLK